MNTIFVKRYATDFPINEREIWRYAGLKGEPEEQLQCLLYTVIGDLAGKLSYRVCYRRMSELPFGTQSRDLAKCLRGCDEVVLFAATIGIEVDRYIAKYQQISATRALLAQAYGAERIEALCDAFCKEMKVQIAAEGKFCTPRFSPGYGDLPLEAQKDIFALLDCSRKVGVGLNESLLMSPSKSVTAIFGVGSAPVSETRHKCENCTNGNCNYRR
ncbi:MAG: Vitamin B12 dependent methionine synthase activation subunit [Oscillospiraceae bacterium]|nr:Vitamin B12 dependent methionine synthase activation subunit [Oscillospiraceae bacterium]